MFAGEVGKEMYIVCKGKLQVMGDNNRTVLATLSPGNYFGELSVLNMGAEDRISFIFDYVPPERLPSGSDDAPVAAI